MLQSPYLQRVYQELSKLYQEQIAFLQAVWSVFLSLDELVIADPTIEQYAVIERLVEPERLLIFKVTWVDDRGKVCVNRGFRVQFSSLLGPYKGGIRFHPSVSTSTMKFLAFEQSFKNALSGLPLGGAKGGSDFNPAFKSEGEIMRFCQNFMLELYRHIGADTDIPAGDLGVGAREIGYLYGMYKKIQNEMTGSITGKGISLGGSLVRREATGYGLCYFVEAMLHQYKKQTLKDKKVLISGMGNVSSFAALKAQELGAIVVGMSHSKGYVYDAKGLDVSFLIDAKKGGNPSQLYFEKYPHVLYGNNPSDMWKMQADIALACAIENEIQIEDAKNLVASGVYLVAEGANMPCSVEATTYFLANNILFAPGKAANAGGVVVSLFEMHQNATYLAWDTEQVDQKLKNSMHAIFKKTYTTAKHYKNEFNLVSGANIAAFLHLKEALIAQGVV